MSNGGKRLNELVRQRGFRLGAVAEAIGVNPNTMTRWTDNAPIGKLFGISEFTSIPITEVIECFKPEPNLGENAQGQSYAQELDRP
jgi:transposase-like protein